MKTHTASIVVLCLASGCAAHYQYVPTANATATVHGRPAADYDIPSAAPEGDVRLASYGMTDVNAEDKAEKLRALHLRVVLADNGTAPWTFDTREQRIELDGHGTLAPAFASANAGSPPPTVTVPPAGKRTVDLFFLLPPGLQKADAVPEFDALWKVQTDRGLITQRTPFERLMVEPEYADDVWAGEYYGPDYYWAGPYWTNPLFPYDGVPHGYFGAGVVIRRAPHFAYHGHGGEHARR